MTLSLPTIGMGDWGDDLNAWLESTQAGVHVETLGVVANDVGAAASNTTILNAHMATLTNTGTDPQNVGKALFFPPEPVFLYGAITPPDNLYSLAFHGSGGGHTFNAENGSGLVQLQTGQNVLNFTMVGISHNAPRITGMNFQAVEGTAAIKIRNWNRGLMQNCYIYGNGAPCIDAAVVDDPPSYGDCAWWNFVDVHFVGTFDHAIEAERFHLQMFGGEITADDRFSTPANKYGFYGTFGSSGVYGLKTDGVRHVVRGLNNDFHVHSEVMEGEDEAWVIGDQSWNPDDPADEDSAFLTYNNSFYLTISGRGSGIAVPFRYGEWARGNFVKVSTHSVSGTYTEDTDWRGVPFRNTTIDVSDNTATGWDLNQPVQGWLIDMYNTGYAANGQNLRLRGDEGPNRMFEIESPNASFVRNAYVYATGGDNGTFYVLQNLAHGAGRGDGVGPKVGFYGTTPIVKQTGVAVSAAGIHAALVALGLISA